MTSKRIACKLLSALFILALLGGSHLAAVEATSFAEYHILYPENSVERVNRAAHEIQKHLLRNRQIAISGIGDYSVKTCHRDSGCQRPKVSDGLSINAMNNHIAIQGGSSFATTAAVQEFLLAVDSGDILPGQAYEKTYLFNPAWINPLCLDSSRFVPVWAPLYTAPGSG